MLKYKRFMDIKRGYKMSHTILPVSPPPIARRLVKTALHQAVLDGRVHQVRLLVEKHGVGVDVKDVYGRTPLMLTSMVDEEAGARMAKILVSAGSDMSLRDNMGRTALSLVCLNGREKIVEEILRKDILNINEPDNDGNTPLHHAATSGNPKIVKYLAELFVKFGLDIDTRNKLGYTALLLACRNGHFVSAHYLLSEGQASPALRDGETYLNATEWTQKSARHAALPARRLASPPSAPAFSRESTMYQKPITHACKHTRAQAMLPQWTRSSDDIELSRNETFFNGKDARQLVLNEISFAETHGWSVKKNKPNKIVHPPTAKLMALSRRRTKSAVPPDMTTIFRMYSDQYQPDWRKERTTITLHASQDKAIPSIIRTANYTPQRSVEVSS
ncbi:ankyrin repeat domain-containing protein 65-like isoform X2 [Mercenaria mercenaria]|uniref:ankyrin repeat domain-containing protein 65-like isoform X2 n=1 Tax=Mercenaria mercenaria TaxID=6596 RepID=UPI00234F23C6|nr:ankyrin repeat domain-containing protein 65-like isoform X2 [Mercenaria mercenaria]